MKKIKGVLYFHDYMTDEEEIEEEIVKFKKEFLKNNIEVEEIKETEDVPLMGHGAERAYNILLFDWGGASMGNSMLQHYCKHILKEALEKPSKIYIMVSSMTTYAMKEAVEDFKYANNGEIPSNVFMNISDSCKII